MKKKRRLGALVNVVSDACEEMGFYLTSFRAGPTFVHVMV